MTGNVKAARNALLNASRHNNAAEELYTYSDLIVDYLAQVGVEYVFGIRFHVQPQVGLTLIRIWSVAEETVFRKYRLNLATEIDRFARLRKRTV